MLRRIGNPLTRLQRRRATQQAEMAELLASVRQIKQTLTKLTLRESQLRAIMEADGALEEASAQLEAIIADDQIAQHVRAAIAATPIKTHPFPHVFVRNLFPTTFYKALIRGLPPVELFEDQPVNHQQLVVPLAMGPSYSRRIWRHLTKVVVQEVMMPAMVDKFRAPLEEWISIQLADPGRQSPGTSHGHGLQRRAHHAAAPRLHHQAAPRSEVGLPDLPHVPWRGPATPRSGARNSTRLTRTTKTRAPRPTGSTRRAAVS